MPSFVAAAALAVLAACAGASHAEPTDSFALTESEATALGVASRQRRAAPPTCGSHDTCTSHEYCDNAKQCAACAWCPSALDSIDLVCPSKCGGAPTVLVGGHLPSSKTEAEASGLPKNAVTPDCPKYRQMVRNVHPRVLFDEAAAAADPHRMTRRLSAKISLLAAEVKRRPAAFGGAAVRVHKAYTASNASTAPAGTAAVSLHHEGRAAVISLDGATPAAGMQAFLYLAAGVVRFDFVRLASADTLYVSVAEDTCANPLDLMFLLDESGSVESAEDGGSGGLFKEKMVGFVKALVPKFTFGDGDSHSRLGVSTFAATSRTHFHLDQHQSQQMLLAALDRIDYAKGHQTATTTGINNVIRTLLHPGRGVRSAHLAIPRVLVVVTDGRSWPVSEAPDARTMAKLRKLGVTVYAIGVGANANRAELEVMASDPGRVFVLKSFAQMDDVVSTIAHKSCATAAPVEAGNQASKLVADCETKYFEPKCGLAPATTVTVKTLEGGVHVYLSAETAQPGATNYGLKSESSNATKHLTFVRGAADRAPLVIAVKGVPNSALANLTADPAAGCAAATRPMIDSIYPRIGNSGEQITVTGAWDTRTGVRANCFWFYDGAAFTAAADKVSKATLNDDDQIICTIPQVGASSVVGSSAPPAGATVQVAVSVWNPLAGSHAEQQECLSHHGVAPSPRVWPEPEFAVLHSKGSFGALDQTWAAEKTYIGCFTDDGHRDLQDGPMRNGYTADMCADACNHYAYFALQHGGECRCGNAYATEAKYTKRPDGECNLRFTRGGGAWRNAVFKVTKAAAPAEYVLAPPGALSCPSGTTLITSKAACGAAAKAVLPAGKSQGRTIQSSSWSWVPKGCAVQSGGDWATHFNTHPWPSASDRKTYSLVCTSSVGERAAFNAAYKAAGSGIVRRECADCRSTHKDVYYRRKTDVANFDAYDYFMVTWSNYNNDLNRDFTLHSTLSDAVTGRNPWRFCNYNDRNIGFPRDCGPAGYVPNQWNSRTRGGRRNVRYSAYQQGSLKNIAPAAASSAKVLNVFEGARTYSSSAASDAVVESMVRTSAVPACDWQAYLDRYVDLQKAFGAANVASAERHWHRHGRGENRVCTRDPWRAAEDNVGEWLQMDLGSVEYVSGVQVQSGTRDQRLTSFTVEVSENGANFTSVDGGKVFSGPMASGLVDRVFSRPVRALKVRVVAKTWQGHITARAAVLRVDGQHSKFQYFAPKRENGFCVTAAGRDVNHGVSKHTDPSLTEKACIDWCTAYKGSTGCEHIIVQRNKGCYVFTTTDIDHGNGRHYHKCWIFHRTLGVEVPTKNLYVRAHGVGGWGGHCTCPDGQAYEVGDYNDACGSLACHGGIVTQTCRPGGISRQNGGMKVTCAAAGAAKQPKRPSTSTAAVEGGWKLVFRQTDTYMPKEAWKSLNPTQPDGPNYSILDQLESFRGLSGAFKMQLSWPPTVQTGEQQIGFCVDKHNRDVNHGIKKHPNRELAVPQCIEWCKAFEGATGCEHIVRQGNRGCYVFTTRDIHHGNNAMNHLCWILMDSPTLTQTWSQNSNPMLRTGGGVEGYKAIQLSSTASNWGGLEFHSGGSCLLDGSVNSGSWWYAVGSTRKFGTGIPGPNHRVVPVVELRVWEEVVLEEEHEPSSADANPATANSFTLDVWSDVFGGVTTHTVQVSESAAMPGTRLRRTIGSCRGNDSRCKTQGATLAGCKTLQAQNSDCRWHYAQIVPTPAALAAAQEHPKREYFPTTMPCCALSSGDDPQVIEVTDATAQRCQDKCDAISECHGFSVHETQEEASAASQGYKYASIVPEFPFVDVKIKEVISRTQPVPYGQGTWGTVGGKLWVDKGLRARFTFVRSRCTLLSGDLSDQGAQCASNIEQSECRKKKEEQIFAARDLTIQNGVQIFNAADLVVAPTTALVYEIVAETNKDDLFFVEHGTGKVFQTGPLDYEVQKQHTIRIAAKDSAHTCLSGFLDLIVDVVNENDNSPVVHSVTQWPRDACTGSGWQCPPEQQFLFNSATAAAATASVATRTVHTTLPEDAPIGTIVFETLARDADGNKLAFSLEDAADDAVASRSRRSSLPFGINAETGAVMIARTLDSAVVPVWNLIISVSDGDNVFRLEAKVAIATVQCPTNQWSTDGSWPCAAFTKCDYATEYEETLATVLNDRVCSVVTKCVLGESYVDEMATRTSNTVCKTVTACGNHEFLAANYTMVSDRVCERLTRCDPHNQYQIVPPTATSNRFCAALTTCDEQRQYESVTKTASSDRTCSALTECDMGEYQAQAPRKDSDRVCQPLAQCMQAEFESKPAAVDAAGATVSDRTCAQIRTCHWDTQYEFVPASALTDRVCKPLTQCAEGDEYEVLPASRVHNSTQPRLSDRVCAALTQCAVDERVSVAHTNFTDRSCEVVDDCLPNNSCDQGQCVDGIRSYTCLCAAPWSGKFCDCKAGTTFSPDGSGDSPCHPVDRCAADEYEVSAPTIAANRVCKTVKACTSDEFISTNATATSDRGCTAVTTCSSVQYRSKDATKYSDAECTALTQCKRGEYESEHQSEKSDRKCSNVSECDWASEYESVTATWNTDRSCAAISSCGAESYIRVPSSNKTDVVCGEITQCQTTEYQRVKPTANTDAACSPLTACTAAEFQLVPPSYTTNRACQALKTCTAEEFILVNHTATTDRHCTAARVCTASEYQVQDATVHSNRVCKETHTCVADEFISREATPFSDRQCTTVHTCDAAKQYRSKAATSHADTECANLTMCGADEKQIVSPTLNSDRQCEHIDDCAGEFCGNGQCVDEVRSFTCACNDGAWGDRCECNSGTYSEALEGLGTPCKPIYECASDEWESQAPTNKTDRQCRKITTCTEAEWQVSAATATSDRACKPLTQCLAIADLEEFIAPTATSDRQCRNIDDCLTKADACDRGSCFDRGSKAPGQVGCDCVGTSYSGDYCDCKSGTTYSDSSLGLFSPCFPISECFATEFESHGWTNTSDRVCQVTTICPAGFFELKAPTKFSDRACAEISPPCESNVQIEVRAPTNTSDRECADTTTTTTTTSTTTTTTVTTTTVITTTATATTATELAVACDLSCINGGKCVLVKSDCSNPDAAYDTPTCDCGVPSEGACFYGATCESKITCFEATLGFQAQSCSPFVRTGRASVKAASVCRAEASAPALCTADNSNAGALAAQSSGAAMQQDGDASDAENDAGLNGIFVMGAGAAGLAVILVGLLAVRRKQEARDVRDKRIFDAHAAINPKFVAPTTKPAMNTRTGDLLWNDFKRCIAFDNAYHGNPTLQLSDDSLVDTFTVLDMKCPPRQFLPALRAVGRSFLVQPVNAPAIADDAANFVASSMADTLVERALDLFATVMAKETTTKHSDAELCETFCAMIESYAPEHNAYLRESADGATRALSPAAEPTYFDIAELQEATEGNYASISEEYTYYSTANKAAHLRDLASTMLPDHPYDSAYNHAANKSLYDDASGELVLRRSTDVTYDYGNDHYDVTYDDATAVNIPVLEEGIYDVGSDDARIAKHTYDAAEQALVSNEVTYGLADARAENDYGLATAPQPRGVYDNSTVKDSREHTYSMLFDLGEEESR